MILCDPRTASPLTPQRDRQDCQNLVTAILKLLVTGWRDGDYQLDRTVCMHRITWSVYCVCVAQPAMLS